jgi:FemAB-related protein (PEP-CTERM system-associated)
MPSLAPAAAVLAPEWDALVDAHPRGSLYHTWRWSEFAGHAFGFEIFRLIDRDEGGRLRGILPLVEQRSPLFGRRLVSLPFYNYGGPLGDTPAAELSLIAQATDLARVRRVRTLEIRDDVPREGLTAREDKVTVELELPDSSEALGKALGSKLRSQVRRADRESPEVAFGGLDLVDEFYPVFAATMRDLGTPVYPKRFFRELLSHLGADCTVVVVRLRGRPAGVALLTHYRQRTEIPWAASLHELRATSVNMRLYWECLVHAIGRGSRFFDFGRSTVDAGTYRFKLQWGGRPRQLHWIYPLEPAGASSVGQGRIVQRAQAAWMRLPLPFANLVGPWISPGLPW